MAQAERLMKAGLVSGGIILLQEHVQIKLSRLLSKYLLTFSKRKTHP